MTEFSQGADPARVALDMHEITQLVYRYCRAMDRIDHELGYSIWHEGATADYGEGLYQGSGTGFIDCLEQFNADPKTEAVVMVGEIGGNAEEKASAWIKANMKKPVVGFIAGLTAPPGRRMGHAGAIVSGGQGTAEAKIQAMQESGIHVCKDLGSLGKLCKKVF